MIFHFHGLQCVIHQTGNVVEADLVMEEGSNCRFVGTVHNGAGRAALLGTGFRNIAAAGACSIIERLDENFLAEVRQKSDYLFEAFQNAKGIKNVSGMGLMIGLETEKPASEVLSACMEKGVLCLTAKTKLRLLPALNIPMDTLKEAVSVILDACQ